MLIWTWAGFAVLASVVLPLIRPILNPSAGALPVDVVSDIVLPSLFTALGALIATRVPGNRIAWILMVVGFSGVAAAWGTVQITITEKPTVVTAADIVALIWLNTGFFVALLIPLLMLPFLFPDGRFLTPRWRWAGWLAGVASVELLAMQGLTRTLGPENRPWTVPNPIGVLPEDSFARDGPAFLFFGLALFALMIGGVVSAVLRYRRSSETVRTQIKWIAFSLVVFVVTMAVRLLLDQYRAAWWNELMFDIALLIVPVSIAVAVTRYRLFDIDRIISRTLGYGLVVVSLGLVYVVGAVWLPALLVEQRPPVFVAGTTLLMVALFNRVRGRIMRWVDRRFYRSRYDVERVAEAFVGRLQDRFDVEELTDDWVGVVVDTMQPRSVAVWMSGRPESAS